MKSTVAVSTLILVFVFAGACLAQENNPDEKALAEADGYAALIRDFVEKQGEPGVIFADIGTDGEQAKPSWKRYATLKDFESAGEDEESYTVAYVWLKEGKPVLVNFTYTSPSGDWAHYVEYVYRPEGSVAVIRKELRTFYGEIIVIRTSVYDPKGKELKSTKEFLDLETQKPKKPTENYQDVDVPVFKKVSELPFAGKLAVSGKQSSSLH